jgi:NADH dehydrogenase/NADH:ubiquinone oxidoreductase subunit G
MHYEKTGTFINCEGQVQRFLQAVQGPKDSKTTLDIMKQLSERLDYRIPWQSSAEVFVELAKRYSELSECTYYTLGDAGKPIF